MLGGELAWRYAPSSRLGNTGAQLTLRIGTSGVCRPRSGRWTCV